MTDSNTVHADNLKGAKLPIQIQVTSVKPGFYARVTVETDVTDSAGLQLVNDEIGKAMNVVAGIAAHATR